MPMPCSHRLVLAHARRQLHAAVPSKWLMPVNLCALPLPSVAPGCFWSFAEEHFFRALRDVRHQHAALYSMRRYGVH
jgi:hypothetical protein